MGIGLATFVESTGPGPTIYGSGGVPISAQDSTSLTLRPSDVVTCASGVTDQGQGTQEMLAQVTADAIGIDVTGVDVVIGDTDKVPYGCGTRGSRAERQSAAKQPGGPAAPSERTSSPSRAGCCSRRPTHSISHTAQ